MEDSRFSQKAINDNTIVINLGKILDNNNAHEMVDFIMNLQTEGFKYIIIDMNELEFLSSAGVGSILGTIETSRENGGDIIICNIPDNIMHILQVLDLVDYLTIKTDLQETLSMR